MLCGEHRRVSCSAICSMDASEALDKGIVPDKEYQAANGAILLATYRALRKVQAAELNEMIQTMKMEEEIKRSIAMTVRFEEATRILEQAQDERDANIRKRKEAEARWNMRREKWSSIMKEGHMVLGTVGFILVILLVRKVQLCWLGWSEMGEQRSPRAATDL